MYNTERNKTKEQLNILERKRIEIEKFVVRNSLYKRLNGFLHANYQLTELL